ncbi:hypothetical protein [Cytophaga aurantiaca]|uniref:hypothetical protein n=1 Tax=Cytophaga aurantiaca TaxID=29530 RepID=UPI0012FBA355|nr:hypothetical protein [Cytophaga aurantiaca]
MRNLFIFLFLFSIGSVSAQQPENYNVSSSFEEDSFRVGQYLHYRLSITYPKERVAIIPDSAFNYFPFEYISKTYYPTRTDSLYAYDSIIYTLASYETMKTQRLSLPVSFFINKDTIKLISTIDSVSIIRLIATGAEKDVQADAGLLPILKKFNYPYLIAWTISLSFILFILYKIFGKIFIKRYKLIILSATHNKFIKEYESLATRFKTTADLRIIEQTLAIWKNYLTRLENKPINTFTTKELILLYDQEELESTLQSLDRNVYGGVVTQDTNDALQTIKRFTHRRFQLRRREVANG